MLKLLTLGVVLSAVLLGGVVTSTGYGLSELQACTNAKNGALGNATVDAARHGPISNVRITRFSDCACESRPQEGGGKRYTCSVDATYSQ